MLSFTWQICSLSHLRIFPTERSHHLQYKFQLLWIVLQDVKALVSMHTSPDSLHVNSYRPLILYMQKAPPFEIHWTWYIFRLYLHESCFHHPGLSVHLTLPPLSLSHSLRNNLQPEAFLHWSSSCLTVKTKLSQSAWGISTYSYKVIKWIYLALNHVFLSLYVPITSNWNLPPLLQ